MSNEDDQKLAYVLFDVFKSKDKKDNAQEIYASLHHSLRALLDISKIKIEEEDNPPTPLPGGKPPSPQNLAKLWNEKAPPELSRVNLPLQRKPKDMDKIKDALKRNPERAWWERVIIRLFDSPHCRGMNDRGWKASFDFMVSHAEVILDGKYDGANSGMAEPKGFAGIREFLIEEGGLS